MSDTSTTALVLKVKCGEPLDTEINGVVVRIECDEAKVEVSKGGFKFPPPPRVRAGTVAFASIPDLGPLLDVGRIATALRANELEDRATLLEESDPATVRLMRSGKKDLSLDSWLTARGD
jgi:hypothetical protein